LDLTLVEILHCSQQLLQIILAIKILAVIMDGFFLHMVLQGLLDHLLLDILKIQLKHLQFHHIIAGVACLAGTLVMLRCNPPSLGDRQQSTTVSKKILTAK